VQMHVNSQLIRVAPTSTFAQRRQLWKVRPGPRKCAGRVLSQG
jgi:hypothetical protein